jgi:hypothetical protein
LTLDRMTARHGLPHPLAILYDRLNQHDPREQWAELLRFAEGAARFLAWVLVAEAAARGAGADRLRRQLGAAGFGAFLHVIGHNLKERRARPDAFLRELDAFVNAPAWAALQAFGALRNDAAHHRLPTTPAAARALLDGHRGALQDLLDGLGLFTRYPLGVLRGAQVTTGGAVTARWFACRGLSTRSGNVEVYGVGALPTGQLLLIDPDARLALTLAPLFVCDEQAFAWLDLPVGGAAGRAGVYARPTPGEAPPAGAPQGLLDVTGAAPRGLTLDAWLGDARQRPRLVGLQLDAPSLRAVTLSAAPTQALEAQAAAVPAGAVIGGDDATTSAARRAAALPPTRVSEAPCAPTVLMAATSVTSVPPTATAREARPAARRWAPPAWMVGLGVGLAIGGAAVGWSLRDEPAPAAPAAAPRVVAVAAAPAPAAAPPPARGPRPRQRARR